jgi:hypothetical protein
MGDGILDGYPIIQDQTSPNLAHIPTTNIITYSEDFSQSIWVNRGFTKVGVVTGPNGTNGYEFVENDTDNNPGIIYNQDTSDGTPRTFSTWLKSSSPTSIALATTGSVKTSTVNVTTDWQFFQCTDSTDTNSGPHIGGFSTITRGSGIRIFVSMPQLEAQTQATTYLPSYGIAAVRKSSTTNLIPYSEDLTELINATNGSGSQTTVTINYALSPDGTQNAGRLQGTSTSSGYALRGFSVNTSSAETYTQSVYLKSNTGSNQNIVFYGRNTPSDSYTVIATNEWQRFEVTGSSTTDYFAYFGLRPGFGSDSTCDILVYGFQIEQQTQAETYAKTTGLPVTIDLFTENNYGTMTNMSASDIIEDTPNN